MSAFILPCRLALIACLLFSLPLASQDPARATGGVGLSVWKDANYRGENATFRNDVADLSRYGLRGSISSLRAGPGELWEVCERVNYGGNCQVFSGSEPNLDRNNWNDRIASVRRVKNGGGGGGDPAFAAATRACTSELERHGWNVTRPETPTRSGVSIVMELQVRGSIRTQAAVARCTYNSRNGTVQVRF
jgi:hypothetical protein